MKKFLFPFIILLFILNISSTAYSKPAPPPVKGAGIVLMDGVTGEILYEKNIDAKLPPASTTKVMTALLALEKTQLTDKVIIGKTPCNADGTSFGLVAGEEFTVEELLNILLIGSCNDAAEALAEHISGSITQFTKLMNTRAVELGCANTNFVNPSGLYEKEHYTSAKDLSLITKELLKHKEFSEITTKLNFKVASTNIVKQERWVYNRLILLQKSSSIFYKDCIGGKTGYTIDAKHSSITAAKRGDQTLIVTILHTDDKFEYFKDSRDLFEYGFNNFKLLKALNKDDKVKEVEVNGELVPLTVKDDFLYTKANDSSDELSIEYNINNLDTISFKKSDVVGNASIKLGSNVIGSVAIETGADKPQAKILQLGSSNLSSMNKFLLFGGSISLIGILFLCRALFLKNKEKIKAKLAAKNKMRN